ncbi:MAG: carboxypeptidase regulatory-like domain-containing protein [Acidobacteria bacterium]|nr:carboxypeptidase regulatory-like domain-containing protein [Acidobacteriota bacterium]
MAALIPRLILLALIPTSLAFAQASFTGIILGTVTDPTGAVVSAANVAVANIATNEVSRARTDAAGNYFVPNLKPGVYSVTVEAAGFKKFVQDRIPLQIDQRARVDASLTVGSTSEVIEVTAAAPVLQTETGSIGQVVDNRKIVGLPLNGRGAFGLIGLVPGVADGVAGGTSGASARINGGRNRLNEIQLDGITAVNIKGGNVGYTPMVDALEEFKIVTNSFSAEYGRTGGGVILATIKSGGNAFHGVVFEFLRNDALNARNFFAPPAQAKPVLRQNQFGAAVGGAIRRDKTFFFVDWQGNRVRTAAVRTSAVPTPAMRGGDLRGFNPIYDPDTTRVVNNQVVRDPIPDNLIPASRFDSASAKVLAYYPQPTGPGLAGNYVLAGPGKRRDDQGDIRIDHNLSDAVKLMGRYSLNDTDNIPSPTYLTPGNPSNYPSEGRQQNAALSYLHTIRPTLINELRAGFNRVYSQDTSPTLGQNYPQQLGVPGVPQDNFPRINITGLTSIGNDRSRPALARVTSYQLADNLTVIRGRHYLKFGFDFRRGLSNNYNPTNASGEFSFGPLQTGISSNSRSGDAFASFLFGQGSGFQLLPGLSSYLSFPSYDVYAQDDFKVSQRLTLNFGLRYEPAFHFVEKYNRITHFNPQRRLLDFAGEDGNPRHFYPNDWNNAGPRFGLAYRLTNSTIVRTGYGMYFASAPVASNPGTPLEAPFPYARSFAIPSAAFPNLPSYVLSRFPGGASDFDRTGRTAGENVHFDRNSRAPYMQSWNFSIQRELRRNLALDLAYAGTKGTRLYTPGSNLNQLRPEQLGPPSQFGGLTSQQRRPFPEFQNIAYNSFGVSSIYHSFQTKLEQRLSGGLSYLISYTWSKALDNGSGLFPGDNPSVSSSFRLQNLYDMRGERSLAADDQAHRFAASYTYDLPWGPGRAWLNSNSVWARALGSWQLGGIALLRSGLPFGMDSTQNTTDSQGGRQRANRAGDGRLDRDQRTLRRFFDTLAFVNPPQYTFGNSARNVLRAPGLVNFDLMVAKNFHFTERVRLDFRAEAFNLMNTPAFGFPGATVGTPQFGVISSTSAGTDARQVQFALKLNF